MFLGVKHHRDRALGGVIKFLPALAITGFVYGDPMVRMTVDAQQAKGVAGEALEKARADAKAFAGMYRNPLILMPMTLAEILPVGALVSLVAAALLRNSRFMSARPV